MLPNMPKAPFEDGCLMVINNQRKTVTEKINWYCYETVRLKEGNVEKAKYYFEKILALCDIATTMDILTNEEREFIYEEIHKFFSGIQIQHFDFQPLTTHHFEEHSVMDLILIYKINLQEKINESLKLYREYDKEKQPEVDREGYMVACNELLEFAKDFYLLQDSDLRTARDIISANKKNKNVPIDKQKVIFVPEHFYTKIPN